MVSPELFRRSLSVRPLPRWAGEDGWMWRPLVTVQRLINMANQIATFFASGAGEVAEPATLDHLLKFWDPHVRRKIVDHVRSTGGEG